MKVIKKDKMAYLCFFIGIILICIIFPLSRGGEEISGFQGVVQWLCLLMLLALCGVYGGISRSRFLIGATIIGYLLIASIAATVVLHYEFNLPRFLVVLTMLTLFSIKIKPIQNTKFLIHVFDIVMLVLVGINALIMLNGNLVLDFLSNNYTQYLSNITQNYIKLKMPIGFWGVGNIASFMYFGLFIISYFLYEQLKYKRYVCYMIICFTFCSLIRGTTSLGFTALMLGFFVYKHRNKKTIAFIALLVFAIILAFLNSNLLTNYINQIRLGQNGFFPRYFSDDLSLYSENYAAVKATLLGIGFTIPRNGSSVYFADSGYIVNFTMGSLIFLILLYGLFYYWVKKNILIKEYKWLFMIYALLMELGFVSFMALKSISMYFIIVMYLKSFQEQMRRS